MKYKNLYINGCSFTAGDRIEEGYTWPELLAEELRLKLINSAKNGQSFRTILYNTFYHLQELDPKDTLVVIGLTWAPRYSIQYLDGSVNITPADTGHVPPRSDFEEKFSSWRRLSSMYTTDIEELDVIRDEILQNKEGLNEILTAFVNYYEKIIKYDDKLKKNQNKTHLADIAFLDSYLKLNKYNYKFINFHKQLPKESSISNENIINIDYKTWNCTDDTAHPTKECCVQIKDIIVNNLNWFGINGKYSR